MFKILTLSAVLALVSVGRGAADAPAEPSRPAAAIALPPGAILQELQSFLQFGRVLYIAAHPDDENTRLLAYFAKGRGCQTGYLSLTRGDGGQNLLGSELRDLLGVIRTQELLAARRIDGAIQFFTRANDFGFSKTPDETFRIWDRKAVLSDVVRVIRRFHPDVIITRFSTEPGVTHGHHTASAILAAEAFRLAGDRTAFPEQITVDGLLPWQPTRLLWNSFSGAMRGGARNEGPGPLLQVNSGAYSPLLGESFGEIAARSRTQHKSQGFGTVANRASAFDAFRVLAGAPATVDVFEGIATSWDQVPGGTDVAKAVEAVVASFDPHAPEASLPALLKLRKELANLSFPKDPVRLTDKRLQLDRVILACLGLFVEATAPRAEVQPGETVPVKLHVIARSIPAGVTIRWRESRITGMATAVTIDQPLVAGRFSEAAASPRIARDAAPSTPYWLRERGSEGVFRVDDVRLIGTPENRPVLPVQHLLEIDGQDIAVDDAVVEVIDDPIRGELRRAIQIVPPVTLSFPEELELFPPGGSRTVWVEMTASRGKIEGTLELELPDGWTAQPAMQPFALPESGSRARRSFTVTAPTQSTSGTLGASALIDGARYRTTRIDIRYDHIPAQLLQPPAQARIVSLNLATKGKAVGYLPGAGDGVADGIRRMGYDVTTLGSPDLTLDRLRRFDAVVLGVRALNTRKDIGPLMPALFAYAEQGGTVIAQYNTTADLQTSHLAPYPLTLSRDRVVDETAPVSILARDHPALTGPNRIDASDFDHWVQERGLYFPGKWDARFIPLLAFADAGEPPREGSLLVTRHGKGYFVYTGLSFFRELPAGVPGAYRLFANLLSLGK